MSEGAKILAVDDDPHTRGLLVELLEGLGYVVDQAEDGQLALERVAAFHPDVVLLDVMMPRLDGFAVLARLRAAPETRELPVLLVSAFGELDGKLRGLGGGATDYVTKPFRLQELQARVEAALALKQTRAARHEAEERLHAAGLGGAPGTFAELREAIQYELQRARRYGRALGALVLELGGLGGVQEKDGKEGVRRARERAIEALREVLRETDRVFDVSDDELVVLLPETDRAGTVVCGERIVEGIDGAAPGLAPRFGAAAFPELPVEAPAALLQAAEEDLGRWRRS